jgi:hypothetical protein
MGAIEALRAQGLTRPVMVRTFIRHWILLLRERAHPLWQHQGITDPMMEFPYPISEELFRVLMIRAITVEYPGEGVGPSPSDAKYPPLAGLPFTRMVSEPPVPHSRVEWMWMMMPPTGMLGAPVL